MFLKVVPWSNLFLNHSVSIAFRITLNSIPKVMSLAIPQIHSNFFPKLIRSTHFSNLFIRALSLQNIAFLHCISKYSILILYGGGTNMTSTIQTSISLSTSESYNLAPFTPIIFKLSKCTGIKTLF